MLEVNSVNISFNWMGVSKEILVHIKEYISNLSDLYC